MKNYTITVNGNVYDVTVEEKGAGAAPAAPKAPAAPAPKAAPAPAAPKAAGAGRMMGGEKPLFVAALPLPRVKSKLSASHTRQILSW